MQSIRSAMVPECGPRDPDGNAIMAPERPALTHEGLERHVGHTVSALKALGLGVGDVVAICLPNGPEMATAFLAVSAAAVAAPLNPAYREEEFRFYLSDLGAKTILLPRGKIEAARLAAEGLQLPVVEVDVDENAPAGVFELSAMGSIGASSADAGLNGPDDLALVLHTSGTTARPKIVGLRQGNLHVSMRNIVKTLELSPSDRCLNVMPLFHIHGLMAALGATIAAGGSIVCTPGFNALRFFSWMSEFSPSWYTAVPTMHQAILERLKGRRPLEDRGLRFIRSSSAALPTSVFTALQEAFRCPVVEAYGMTEAAHQISSNPLAAGTQCPGSVGFAAGPEIAIMDADGHILPPDTKGEIVLRGANVHEAYLSNREANAASFTDGWFRTGDQGQMDEEGRLTITGRLKELINRGGEKISPLEIDNVLLGHPGVAQAVAFGVPHKLLGEEVAAAIVARDGAELAADQIRDYVRQHLVDFKVPRRIVVVDEIPKGPTGKIQRTQLPARLGMDGTPQEPDLAS